MGKIYTDAGYIEINYLDEFAALPAFPDDEGDVSDSEGAGYGLEDFLDGGDTEDEDIVLVYADDTVDALDYGDALKLSEDVLSEYTLSEIIDLNELTDAEVLATLFEAGEIGLPSEIADEEVQDLPPEEDDEG